MEGELAVRRRGVYLVVEAVERPTLLLDLVDQVDQVFERPCQAVELPDDDMSPLRNWSSSF